MSAQATRRWEDDSLMLTQQHLCNASRGLLSAATRATCPPHGSPARDRALEEEAARALALHRQELARLTAVIRVNQTFGAQRRAEIEADISRASTRCGHAEYEHFRSLSALHALQSVNEGVARATHGAAFADERERGAYIEDIARLHDSVRRRFSGRERDLLDRQIQRILRGPTNDSRPLGDRHNVAEQGAERDVLGARPRAPPDNNKRALTDGTGHAVPQGDADLAPPGAGREPLTSYTRPRVDYRKREPSLQGHAEPTTVDPWAPSGPHREAPDLCRYEALFRAYHRVGGAGYVRELVRPPDRVHALRSTAHGRLPRGNRLLRPASQAPRLARVSRARTGRRGPAGPQRGGHSAVGVPDQLGRVGSAEEPPHVRVHLRGPRGYRTGGADRPGGRVRVGSTDQLGRAGATGRSRGGRASPLAAYGDLDRTEPSYQEDTPGPDTTVGSDGPVQPANSNVES